MNASPAFAQNGMKIKSIKGSNLHLKSLRPAFTAQFQSRQVQHPLRLCTAVCFLRADLKETLAARIIAVAFAVVRVTVTYHRRYLQQLIARSPAECLSLLQLRLLPARREQGVDVSRIFRQRAQHAPVLRLLTVIFVV